MIYCPGCGTANRDGSRFCNECGQRLADETWPTCSRCGAANPEGTAHCRQCGLDLAHPAPETPAPSEQAPRATLRNEGLPPWLDSAERFEDEPLAHEAAPSDSFETRPLQGDWPFDALPIEPIVGVPYRAHERVTLPPTAEQRTAARIFAESAAEEVHASPQDVSAGERGPSPSNAWRRLIACALLVALLVPLFVPIAPLSAVSRIPTGVAAAHEAIQALPAGATVLVVFDYDAGLAGDLQPVADAYLQQLLACNLRVITVSTLPEGAALADAALERARSAHPSAAYGETVLNLGYVAGGEAAVRALAADLAAAAPADYRLTRNTRTFPLLVGITGARDLPLIVVLGRDLTALQRWIEQAATPYGTPLLAGVPALLEPALGPYRSAGQLRGIVGGLSGAAAYEQLQNRPGAGLRSLASVRLGACTVAAIVVLANLAGLVRKKRKP